MFPNAAYQPAEQTALPLLHEIAHIELNTIVLALDMAGRYANYGLPFDFVRDWSFLQMTKPNILCC